MNDFRWTRAPRAAAVALLAAMTLGGCGYTASPALLPPHLKTVAIPVFENTTGEYTLEQEITQAVVERFVQDNHVKIVDEKSADAVVRGKVTQYKNTVFGFATASEANEFRITIGVSVVFKDLAKNREIWSDQNLVKTANYYVQDVPGQTARTPLDGRKEAVSKIADEILARSLQSW